MKKTRFILAALVALVASVFVTSCTEDSENSFSKEFVKPHEVDSTTTGMWSTALMEQSVDEKFQNYAGTYVTTKTTTADGEVTDKVSDSVKVEFKFPHSLVAKSNWTSEQEASTATASKSGVSSADAKDTTFVVNGDFVVKATKITEKIQATVRLADGTSRTDVWEEVHFTGVSVSRGEDVLQFTNFPTGADNKANTKANSDKVYTYGDTLSYTLGENVSKATAPGTITIKVEEPEPDTFFPKEWGKLLEVRQLHSLNENGTAGVDTWCMYFKDASGVQRVLPVVVNGTPAYDFKLVEQTNVDSYNGAAYNTSLARPRWQAVYGVKEASCISYTRESKVIEKVGYLQASRLSGGWNVEDSGNFDCKIDRYSFSIKDGVFTAYKKGAKLGEWTYYNK